MCQPHVYLFQIYQIAGAVNILRLHFLQTMHDLMERIWKAATLVISAFLVFLCFMLFVYYKATSNSCSV